MITRRKFAFWVSFGLFTLAEKLHAETLEKLATPRFDRTEPTVGRLRRDNDRRQRHRNSLASGENSTWRWFERESWATGRWKVTGITVPVSKRTGESSRGKQAISTRDLVPERSALQQDSRRRERARRRAAPARSFAPLAPRSASQQMAA